MSLETDTELSEFLSTAHTGPGMHSRWSKQCVFMPSGLGLDLQTMCFFALPGLDLQTMCFLPSKTLKAWDLFGPWLLCENIIY